MGYASYEVSGVKGFCGYAHPDICWAEGCEVEIDRGLAYACGDEPGVGDDYCEGYFCYSHLFYPGKIGQRCSGCSDLVEARHGS